MIFVWLDWLSSSSRTSSTDFIRSPVSCPSTAAPQVTVVSVTAKGTLILSSSSIDSSLVRAAEEVRNFDLDRDLDLEFPYEFPYCPLLLLDSVYRVIPSSLIPVVCSWRSTGTNCGVLAVITLRHRASWVDIVSDQVLDVGSGVLIVV
jgi:hypothetical protein